MDAIITPDDQTMKAITSLLDDTSKLDKVFDETEILRKKLTTKLIQAVDELELNVNNTKPKDLEAKMMVITTAAGLLNDQDRQQISRVNVKLKINQGEDNKEVAKLITDLLTTIQTTGTGEYNKHNERTLEQAISDNNIEVLDTELRADPTDLS